VSHVRWHETFEANHSQDLATAALPRERRTQATLLRCIVGSPFRAAAFDPAWQTLTGLGLARAIYDERRFSDLPILADALEEAGCTNADLLAHCRGPGPHVRGCWVVDLVLDKK
jgi:hypothetical protein